MLDKRNAFMLRPASLGVSMEPGNRVEKSLRCPQQLQLPRDRALDDVLSDLHFQTIKTETRAFLQHAATKERTCLEAQRRIKLAVHEAEMYRETQLLKRVADFAYNLLTETGVSVDHPCIQKLLEVADASLDPRELLLLYKSEPLKLAIIDDKDPGWCWLPYIPRSRQELLALSRKSALKALVGKYINEWNELGFLYIKEELASLEPP
ncbi:hypothetical protein COCOBI_01-8170 [Coccomyxa sp. Obi]|nr:hypothetical protein COCOBI_01-8170 [Coccomyxa sp. Obi]